MHRNHKIGLTSCSIEAVALYGFIATFFLNAFPDKFLPTDDAVSWKSAAVPAQVHVKIRWRLIFFTEGNDGISVKVIGIMNFTASRSHSDVVIGGEVETLRSESWLPAAEITDVTW